MSGSCVSLTSCASLNVDLLDPGECRNIDIARVVGSSMDNGVIGTVVVNGVVSPNCIRSSSINFSNNLLAIR